MAKKGKYIYDWPRPMVTVDAVVFTLAANTTKLLLINRKKKPFKGQWALPGGFIGIDEELEDAVVRELKEETGISDVKLKQIHAFGKCGRDPRGRQITIVYMGIISKKPQRVKAADDAAKARWFNIEKLPEELAFDHDEIIQFAISKLKRKSIYRTKPGN